MAKKKSMAEVRWAVSSEDNPEHHDWSLLIINESRRARKIWGSFVKHMQPPMDEIRERRTHGRIRGTRLEYIFTSCTTYHTGPHNINWRGIYSGELTEDKKL